MPFSALILESLTAEEELRGEGEGESIAELLVKHGMKARHHKVSNEEDFTNAVVSHYQEELTVTEPLPSILHVSVHGTEHGFQFANGTFVPWKVFRPLLAGFTELLNGNLVLVMSSCFGFTALKMALDDGELPVAALIGCRTEPSLKDTFLGYRAFYETLLTSGSFATAMDALNAQTDSKGFMLVTREEFKVLFPSIWKSDTITPTQ